MQRPSVIAALLVVAVVIGSAPVPVALVASAKDSSNRFPETGAFIVWAGPNAAGTPGLRAICSGALIHERVFLTAGHCVGRGVRGLPPFVQVAVSFDPANAFDRASWVPVTRLIIHPSLPEACLSAPGCDPTTTGVFPAGAPARADVGLAILARPVRNIKPAVLARPAALTDARVARLPMTVVGYGSTQPIPRGSAPPAAMWDGSRRFRTSAFEKSLNDYWGTWRLPSRVCAGDSGAPTFVDDPRDNRARRLVAVVSDGGIDCASTDARVRVDTAAMQEWIARVIRDEVVGPSIDLDKLAEGGTRSAILRLPCSCSHSASEPSHLCRVGDRLVGVSLFYRAEGVHVCQTHVSSRAGPGRTRVDDGGSRRVRAGDHVLGHGPRC